MVMWIVVRLLVIMTCQSLITYALRHELLVMTDVVVHVHVQQVDEVQQVGEVGHCDKVAHHGEVQGLSSMTQYGT